MRRILLAGGALALAAVLVLPLAGNAATTKSLSKNGTLKSFTRDSNNAITAVVVTIPGTAGAADSDMTFAVSKKSTFRDKFSQQVKTAYMAAGDSVSAVYTDSSTTNANVTTTTHNLLKLTDNSIWQTMVSGTVSNIQPVTGFDFAIPRRVKELGVNAIYNTHVNGSVGTPVFQVTLTKVGKKTTRTTANKLWTDIQNGQVVTVWGVWSVRTTSITATKVQMPNIVK